VNKSSENVAAKAADLGAHFELDDLYLVSDDWRLVTLVKGGIKHLYGIVVELV
jgi:hypothetical protein